MHERRAMEYAPPSFASGEHTVYLRVYAWDQSS